MIPVDIRPALLDLRFVAWETSNKITFECEYNIDLFETETIKHLVNSYNKILEEFIQHLEVSVSQFELAKGLEAQAGIRTPTRREQVRKVRDRLALKCAP